MMGLFSLIHCRTSMPCGIREESFIFFAAEDGAFQESVLRSAPYFSLRIDGITELNNN